jgi:NAD(P)-dependent dehydrogenase (short-subunit alcohol dehydrogenase family)
MTDRSSPLAGRRAVITGASRGIGRSIALLFAECGADVLLVSRNEEALLAVAEEIAGSGHKCAVLACDVTAPDAAARIVEAAAMELGGIDILVNNAGGNSFMSSLQSMRLSGWDKTLRLNLESVVYLSHAALPLVVESGNASIINVSSVTGVRSAPFMSHYGAAKAAVISLTRSLAVETAKEGVRVNALAPGWIETDLTGFLRDDEGIETSVLKDVPMGRWGRPEEIAEAALFLASDASSFVTGQTLVADGGLTVRP